VSHMNGSSVFQFRLHRFGLDALLDPQRPRSRWLKLVWGALGIVLMAVLLVLGVIVGVAMLLFGLLRRALRNPQPAPAPGHVLEAEYQVVATEPERTD